MVEKRKSSRRQFFKGQSAIDALADLSHGTDEPDALQNGSPATRSYLMQVVRTAMACEFQIYLNAGQHQGGAPQ